VLKNFVANELANVLDCVGGYSVYDSLAMNSLYHLHSFR